MGQETTDPAQPSTRGQMWEGGQSSWGEGGQNSELYEVKEKDG